MLPQPLSEPDCERFDLDAASGDGEGESFGIGVNNRDEVTTTPEQLPLDVKAAADSPAKSGASAKPSSFAAMQNQEDAPPCSTCGSIMVRSGACYKCANCGTTSGCA